MLFASGDESPSSMEREDRKGMGARRKGLDGTLEHFGSRQRVKLRSCRRMTKIYKRDLRDLVHNPGKSWQDSWQDSCW